MSHSDDASFRILVLGDFSGRGSRGEHAPEELTRRRLHRVDRDEFEGLFAKLGVAVRLTSSPDAIPVDLPLRSLDDLHPDRLLETVAAFGELRALRRRLNDPRSFADAARELGAAAVPGRPATPAPAPAAPATDDLLGAALAATDAGNAARGRGAELVDALLRELVVPHLSPAPDPRRDGLLAAVDGATGALLRTLLRQPAVRALECAWRGLELLLRRLDTDAVVHLELLDLTRAELRAALGDEPLAGGFGRRLVEGSRHTPGAEPWSLLVLAESFDATPDDARFLARLGGLAMALDAPLVAAGNAALVGCAAGEPPTEPDAWNEHPEGAAQAAWQALRVSPCAGWLALTWPRLLLRLPYGARGGSVEGLAFEELADADDHEGYLWGSGAFAVAIHLGSESERLGGDLRADACVELAELPAHVRERDGETTLQPCAELVLTERAAERVRAAGLLPLRAMKGRDAVQLGPLRALDGGLLRGRWS
ncbi:MAG: type VI secretion system contractile sheath large subunit [Planctomycetes bacterium]|nr:type VI secretion system contractile sheath large subunit [Planctomycetota bacterium]